MLKKLVLATLLLCFNPYSFAEEGKVDPQYQGIEITVNINQASAEEIADLLIGIG